MVRAMSAAILSSGGKRIGDTARNESNVILPICCVITLSGKAQFTLLDKWKKWTPPYECAEAVASNRLDQCVTVDNIPFLSGMFPIGTRTECNKGVVQCKQERNSIYESLRGIGQTWHRLNAQDRSGRLLLSWMFRREDISTQWDFWKTRVVILFLQFFFNDYIVKWESRIMVTLEVFVCHNSPIGESLSSIWDPWVLRFGCDPFEEVIVQLS